MQKRLSHSDLSGDVLKTGRVVLPRQQVRSGFTVLSPLLLRWLASIPNEVHRNLWIRVGRASNAWFSFLHLGLSTGIPRRAAHCSLDVFLMPADEQQRSRNRSSWMSRYLPCGCGWTRGFGSIRTGKQSFLLSFLSFLSLSFLCLLSGACVCRGYLASPGQSCCTAFSSSSYFHSVSFLMPIPAFSLRAYRFSQDHILFR